MPYTNAAATPRADIFALVMQANADFNTLFIGDQVFPVKGEDAKRGIYMKAKLANAELMNPDGAQRDAGAGYNRVNRKYDTDTYDAQEYGIESVIDDAYEQEVDRFMNLEKTEAMLIERSLRMLYEFRVAAQVFNSSVFNTTNSTVAYTASNIATIDSVNDIDLAKQRLLLKGIIPNTVIMNFNVFQRIRRSTLLQNQIFGVVPRSSGQRMLPGEQDVAEALGVDKLIVAKAASNTALKGQTFAGGFIWSNSYIMVCQVQDGEYEAGGIGRTIQWTRDTTGLFTPETYRDDTRRSNIMRVRQHTAEKVIDETAGELINCQYA